jgi:hypothetical protein
VTDDERSVAAVLSVVPRRDRNVARRAGLSLRRARAALGDLERVGAARRDRFGCWISAAAESSGNRQLEL